jgi:tRNA pseudouridine55 synthase
MTASGGRPSRARVSWRDVDGILLLDKPSGLSSNAALQQARRLFRARKAGHTGSLDPLASGLLPLCFGQATKVAGLMLDADKRYLVAARLGERTSTGDAEGEVTRRLPVPAADPARLEAALAGFRGPILQVPPMHSALKQGGRRLYALARQVIEVAREARPVRIHELAPVAWEGERLELAVTCSKGTYVRTLVEDLAAALGTAGHVVELRRTGLGPFRDGNAWTLEALEALRAEGGEDALDRVLLPADRALGHWAAVQVGPAERAWILKGQAVFANGPGGARVRIYGPGGDFLGIGDMTPEGRRLTPVRLMVSVELAPGDA